MRFPGIFAIILFIFSTTIAVGQPAAAKSPIRGSVIDDVTGKPIAGARIKLDTRTGDPTFVLSSDDGHFTLPDIGQQSYSLSVRAQGFLAADRIQIKPGENPTIRLTAYGVIAGRVTDPEGLPIPNARIEILVKQAGRPANTSPLAHPLPDGMNEIASIPNAYGQTDDRGEFRVPNLKPGSYYLVVNKPQSWPQLWEPSFHVTYYPQAIDFEHAKTLEVVAAKETRADVQILKQTGFHVAGRIQIPGDSMSAFRFARIILTPEPNYAINNSAFTAGNNDYRFDNVAPGTYMLFADIEKPSDEFNGSGKPIYGVKRRIEVRTDLDSVDLEFTPIKDISGKVTFQEGCASRPLTINLTGASALGPGPSEVTTHDDGSFTLSGLMPGSHKLIVRDTKMPGRMTWIASAHLGNRDVMQDGFDVLEAGNDRLEIVAACTPARSGR